MVFTMSSACAGVLHGWPRAGMARCSSGKDPPMSKHPKREHVVSTIHMLRHANGVPLHLVSRPAVTQFSADPPFGLQ